MNRFAVNAYHKSVGEDSNHERMVFLGFHFFLLFLVVLVTLLTNILPDSSLINRFLIGIFLIVSILLILLKFKPIYIVFLILVAGIIAVDYMITKGELRHLNDLFYLPLWCINLVVFCLYKEETKTLLRNNYKWFLLFAFIWNIVTVVSLFSQESFIVSNGVRAFVGFTGQSHRFAGTALFTILCCAIVLANNNKKSVLLLSIIPLISVFFCGARTYLVVALAFIIFLLVKVFPSKRIRRFVLIAGMALIVGAGFYVTVSRASGSNYEWAVAHYGYLHFITSGRTSFWNIDLEQFFLSPIINIFVGRGYNFVYEVNEMYYDTAIWAHNDYINVLISHGIIGLLLFLTIFVAFIKSICKRKRMKSINAVFLGIYLFMIVFNAFFNMAYTYTIANLITPLFGIVMLDYQFKRAVRGNSCSAYLTNQKL